MNPDHLSAIEGFVLAMLAMMFVSASIIGLLIFCGLRNASRRDPQVDELLDEVAGETQAPKNTSIHSEAPQAEPWEKDGDWWRR